MRPKLYEHEDRVTTTFNIPRPVLNALKRKALELSEKRRCHVSVNTVILMCVKRAGIVVEEAGQ